MKNSDSPQINGILVAACGIFDLAIIIWYCIHFSLFTLLSPGMSALVLFVLLIGLGIVNYTTIYQTTMQQRIGIAFATSLASLSIFYAIISNLLSFIFFTKDILYLEVDIWSYVIWELIVLAVFLGIYAVINSFASKFASNNEDMTH